MILVIDAGNTRVKWGLHHNGRWRGAGAVPTATPVRLAADWKKITVPERILVANVAGRQVRRKLESILSQWPVAPVWVTSKRRECGVTNGYRDPAQLGADRWAALVGARALVAGPCLVVNAGTATTVDILRGDGKFVGGAILPGLALMKRSLAQSTAKLPLAKGRYSEKARDTAGAIETGCLLAQAGAIERMFAVLEPGALCAISGGSAEVIAKRLRVPVRVVDNLVLEGLVRIAAGLTS
jgi:type III pantothenate kinase